MALLKIKEKLCMQVLEKKSQNYDGMSIKTAK
jgi:hypothetical protein